MARNRNRNKKSDIDRSISRGAEARGLPGVHSNGKDAVNKAKKSTKGKYHVAFSKMYESLSERDIELRFTYGKDLVSAEVGVPSDMITLDSRRKVGKQTLTSRDEIFYVKVGTYIYGKLSIRTQRTWKGNILIFVYQSKKSHTSKTKKPFSGMMGWKKQTPSQKAQSARNAYNNRKNRGK